MQLWQLFRFSMDEIGYLLRQRANGIAMERTCTRICLRSCHRSPCPSDLLDYMYVLYSKHAVYRELSWLCSGKTEEILRRPTSVKSLDVIRRKNLVSIIPLCHRCYPRIFELAAPLKSQGNVLRMLHVDKPEEHTENLPS